MVRARKDRKLTVDGWCYHEFQPTMSRGWNLFVFDVNHITSSTMSIRVAGKNINWDESDSCGSTSFKDYMAAYPLDDIDLMIGGYPSGYKGTPNRSFKGYIRHVKYYIGALLY